MFVKDEVEKGKEAIFSAQSASSGEGIFPDSAYLFTEGWHILYIADWENHMKEFKGKPEIHALEIGNF